jgi:hypothetical protein
MSAATNGSKPNIKRSGGASGVEDVVELILDKGLVIDVFARVSLVGTEILTIDARATVASLDTFLHYAEATNRLDLHSSKKRGTGLPGRQGNKQARKSLDPAAGKVKSVEEQVEDIFKPPRQQR